MGFTPVIDDGAPMKCSVVPPTRTGMPWAECTKGADVLMPYWMVELARELGYSTLRAACEDHAYEIETKLEEETTWA